MSETREDRAKRGAFYTPYDLARETVAATLRPLLNMRYPAERIIICDPACGDGVFLAAAREQLTDMLQVRFGCSADDARRKAEGQLIGFDIAPQAVAAARALMPGAVVLEADALLGEDYWTANRAINVFVGNPPFLGGHKIGSALGVDYQKGLKAAFPDAYQGKADLSAWFFRRCAQAVEAYGFGVMGLIATNTIAQGDTRLAGLKYLVDRGWEIYEALRDFTWPGDAAVCCSRICMGWWKHGVVERSNERRPTASAHHDGCLACRLSTGELHAVG